MASGDLTSKVERKKRGREIGREGGNECFAMCLNDSTQGWKFETQQHQQHTKSGLLAPTYTYNPSHYLSGRSRTIGSLEFRGWRDDSLVVEKFHSQHSHDNFQPPVAPVSGTPKSSFDLRGTVCMWYREETYMQTKHPKKLKQNKNS